MRILLAADIPARFFRELSRGHDGGGRGTTVADEDFARMLRRVRAGEEGAARELVAAYEPEIRRIVRLRLTDPRLRRVLDTMDVCQSVLANFFVRVSAGEFDLTQPEQLLALLLAMARNKVLEQARRQQTRKRDLRRVVGAGNSALDGLQGPGVAPDRAAAGRDLLAEVRRRLTDEERYLADQRGAGREWADLAAELGAAPDALRKKLSRALDRVMAQLGLEEADHD
jgi:RNA polymerase sigma-70 factor (ECF subfamily)